MAGLNDRTKLLLHGNGQNAGEEIVDSGVNGHVVTQVGTSQLSTHDYKFGTGSAVFSGGRFDVGDTSDFNFMHQLSNGKLQWTFECWFKNNDLSTTQMFTGNNEGNSVFVGHAIWFEGTTRLIKMQISNGGSQVINAIAGMGAYPNDNEWHHVAVTYDHSLTTNNAKCYIDGTFTGQATKLGPAPSIANATRPNVLGALESVGAYILPVNGKIDEMRFSNVVRYDTSFATPFSPHKTDKNTKLLLHFNKEETQDDVKNLDLTYNGTAYLKKNESKFGTGSLRTFATGDYASLPAHSSLDMFANNTENWTMETFFKRDSNLTNDAEYFFLQLDDGSNYFQFMLNLGAPLFNFRQGGVNQVTLAGTAILDTEWHHMVVVKKGNEYGLYLDGVQIGYGTSTAQYTFTSQLEIGGRSLPTNTFDGWTDEMRIQKSDVYGATPVVGLTDTITVPTQELNSDVNTGLLLHFEDDLTDSSSHAHTVTASGNAIVDSSKFGNGSLWLDGNSDYVSLPDSPDWDIFALTTEDYTIDFWAKHLSLTASCYIQHFQDGNNFWWIRESTGGVLTARLYDGSDIFTISSAPGVLTVSNWHHIALIKSGTNIGLYLNGVQVAYKSLLTTHSFTSPLEIGMRGTGSAYHSGNIDNLRIEKNNSFGITPDVGLISNFTPPTEQHSKTANTKLLLHFDGDILDDSANPHTPIQKGSVLIDYPLFGSTSLLLDGNSDYLTIPASQDLDLLDKTDFTLEMDVRLNQFDNQYLYTQVVDNNNRIYLANYKPSTSYLAFYAVIGGSVQINMVSSVPADLGISDSDWHHVAVTKQGTSWKLFLDGLEIASATASTAGNVNANINIGAYPGVQYADGYVDEIRISDVARYSADFIIPTIEHVEDANTDLLLHLNTQDVSGDGGLRPFPKNPPATFEGSSEIDFHGRFGIGSAKLNGTTDYLSIPDSTDFDFSSGDFTLEGWFNFDSLVGNKALLYQETTQDSDFMVLYHNQSSGLSFRLYSGASLALQVSEVASPILDNLYHHIAVVKNGTTYTVYKDGVSVASTVSAVAPANYTGNFEIGHINGGGGIFNPSFFGGNIDELRISNNARYTANFAVQLNEHSTDANTKLLLHLDSDFSDSSSSAHTVTPVGTTHTDKPKFGEGSLKLNGTTDYLTVPDSYKWNIFDSLTSDQTISLFVRHNTTNTVQYYLNQWEDGNNTWGIVNNADGSIQFFAVSGGSIIINMSTSAGIISDTDWHNVVVAKKGNNFGLYVDGIQRGHGVLSTTDSLNASLAIGARGDNTRWHNGNIDDFIIEEANLFNADPNVGLTDTITVPTVAHTANDNTSLLYPFNSLDISQQGGTYQYHIPEFKGTAQLDTGARKIGIGSLFLDGASGYLQESSTTSFDFMHKNGVLDKFTIEAWVRFEPGFGNSMIFSTGGESSIDEGVAFEVFSNQQARLLITRSVGGTSLINVSTAVGAIPADGQWHHLSATYDHSLGSNNGIVYLDGINIATATKTLTPSGTNHKNPRIGASANGAPARFFDGNLDELHITNNLKYTGNFIPATSEIVPDANTKLLMHFDSDFIDSSSSAHVFSRNGVNYIDNPVFGNASMWFDGNSDWIEIAQSTDFDLENEFAVDFHFRPFSLGTAKYLAGSVRDSAPFEGWYIAVDITLGKLEVYSNNNTLILSGNHGLTVGEFSHIALLSDGKGLGLYVDGVQIAYNASPTVQNTVNSFFIGNIRQSGALPVHGNVDEFRIQHSNIFSATPNVGLTDTVEVPTQQYDVILLPDAPTGLTATTFDKQRIDLSWTAPVDGDFPVTGYRIERESPVGGGWSVIVVNTGNTNTNYNDIGLEYNTQYNYRVSAINLGGYGDASNEANDTTDAGEPSAPTGLVASFDSVGSIRLDWNIPANDGGSPITGYKIETESPVGGGWSTLVADTGTIDTNYTHGGLVHNTEHNYRVSAINAIGTSIVSNESSTYTRDLDTKLLLHLTGDDNDTTTVDLSGNNHPVTIDSPGRIETDKFKFDGSSFYTSGVGSAGQMIVADDGSFPGGEGDWTIEFWASINRYASTGRYFYYQNEGGVGAVWIRFLLSGGDQYFQVGYGGVSDNYLIYTGAQGNAIVAQNHYAFVREGNKITGYRNGDKMTQTFNPSFPISPADPTGNIYMGNANNGNSLDAYMDEIRISDVARYTADFGTPYTRAFYTLGAPTSLVATNSFTGVQLNWTKPDNDGGTIVGYKIERESPIGGGWSTIVVDTGTTDNNYLDETTTEGIEYNYRVSAVNIHGSGLASNESEETYIPLPPATEEGVVFNKFLKMHQSITHVAGQVYMDKFTGEAFRRVRKD